MSENKSKRKEQRKDTLSLRIEPRIKYLIDIASRIQRRNVTNYVEQVLEDSLQNIEIDNDMPLTKADLWDIYESDRFIKLAYSYPSLLSYDEHIIFKILNDNFEHFKKNADACIFNNDRHKELFEKNIPLPEFIDFKKVRNHWQALSDYAQGKGDLEFIQHPNQ